ncbi:MAG: lysine--tRNA ligase, partial [Bacteroidales bacterium]|nr:lysine--tRNA ligase [Bacteroidales bacterium]
MDHLELSEQEQIRRDSLNELNKLGINAFPADEYAVSHYSADILENFDGHEDQYTEVCLAGRIMSRRIMGSASFAEIKDAQGRIQIYIRRDDICPDEDKAMYNTVFKRLLDIGDIIGVKGHVFKTQTGEISVHVT